MTSTLPAVELTVKRCHLPLGWKLMVEGSGDSDALPAVAVGVLVDVDVALGVGVAEEPMVKV